MNVSTMIPLMRGAVIMQVISAQINSASEASSHAPGSIVLT